MKTSHAALAVLSLALSVNASAVQFLEGPAMGELVSAAPAQLPPPPPPAAAKPAAEKPKEKIEKTTILCSMNLRYRERVDGLLILRVYKKIRGTATILCEGSQPVEMVLSGEGPSLGFGIPNKSPFRANHNVVAGNVQIRLPAPFIPKHLEGTYYNAGVEIIGAGVSFSPWINSDKSFNVTIYLPNSLNLSAAINLNKLKLRLKK
jgi:hypothetical protein